MAKRQTNGYDKTSNNGFGVLEPKLEGFAMSSEMKEATESLTKGAEGWRDDGERDEEEGAVTKVTPTEGAPTIDGGCDEPRISEQQWRVSNKEGVPTEGAAMDGATTTAKVAMDSVSL
ncbi:hypothetical protein PIB30_101958 [Stylosanthes scabra]|uniref:Uncharacterized protein n=1 Tax=Stylosanthes scabra TaxID=79078 RepID=A0ABU6UWJ8_9FABA|nr:hypothetical protein [Stylosanthes scabra]